MLDELGLDGKDIMDGIASAYLEDFVNYREQDFGMTNLFLSSNASDNLWISF